MTILRPQHSSKVTMDSTSPPVYAEQLFQKAHGYPLWFPEHAPAEHTARIGDIGYISCGKFRSLFNATLPAEDSTNNKVPQGFSPLNYDKATLLRTQENYLPDGALSSHTVRSVGHEGGLGARCAHRTCSLDARSYQFRV